MSASNEEQQISVNEASNKDDDDEDVLCGLGDWRPAWLQRFATPRSLIINLSVVAVLQGAIFTYLMTIMSTLEKRYGFDAKVSSFILIADNLVQFLLSPVAGWAGSRYNRSRMIAWGEIIVALSCFLAASPYFLFGPNLQLLGKQIDLASNQTQFDLCLAKDEHVCATEEADDAWTKFLAAPVVIFWIANFTNGVGFCVYYAIAFPYIDDNVPKKNSPIYISLLLAVRFIGPATGYILSSACLGFYEKLDFDPGISTVDPRYIGAWWLGHLVLGIGIAIFSIPMFLFPPSLRQLKKTAPTKDDKAKQSDLWGSLSRILTNGVLVCHTAAGVVRLIGYNGYYVFKSKYIEQQYRQSASGASFFTGASSVGSMAVGSMLGGVLVHHFRPKPRTLAIWIFVIGLVGVSNFVISGNLNCATPSFSGLGSILDSKSEEACNAECHCSTRVYQPICASDGVTNYFSPCHAGCRQHETASGNLVFHNCSCIAADRQSAESGLCPTECNMFTWFMGLHAVSNFIGALSWTGDIILTLRCVEPRDKNFSLGLTGGLYAFLAFIPAPIIFGAIIDSTCLVWAKTCGTTRNCFLYDIDLFRNFLHYGVAAFVGVGLIFELGTIYYAKRVTNLYDEQEEEDDKLDNIELHSIRLRSSSYRSN